MLLPQGPSIRRKLHRAGAPNWPTAAGEARQDTGGPDWPFSSVFRFILNLPFPLRPGPALELSCRLLSAPSQGPAPPGASMEFAAP